MGVKKRIAFTLAEVLITLGIIGVVAAMVMPTLITNIQDRVKANRVQNIQQKFSKATDKMLAVSGLNGYDSTMDFVNELKNHLSIAKVCKNNDLRSCWTTDKVLLNDGTEWEISKTTTAKTLKMTNDEYNDWDDTVGIITADGTAIILSYNKLCNQDPISTPSWDSNKSSSTSCVAAIYDWNGSNKPNTFNMTDSHSDVLALNANGLGQACALEVNSRCFGTPFYPIAVTKAECEAMKSTHGIKGCYEASDYWAGAVKQCGHVNNMPTMADLGGLASYIYQGNPSIGAYEDKSGLTYIANSATSLGFPEPSFQVWSGEEKNNDLASVRIFYASSSEYNVAGIRSMVGSNRIALCAED